MTYQELSEKNLERVCKVTARRRREKKIATNVLVYAGCPLRNPSSNSHTRYFDNLKYDVS